MSDYRQLVNTDGIGLKSYHLDHEQQVLTNSYNFQDFDTQVGPENEPLYIMT